MRGELQGAGAGGGGVRGEVESGKEQWGRLGADVGTGNVSRLPARGEM